MIEVYPSKETPQADAPAVPADPPTRVHRIARLALWLDHRADRHLAEGRHGVAERLSHKADALRRAVVP